MNAGEITQQLIDGSINRKLLIGLLGGIF